MVPRMSELPTKRAIILAAGTGTRLVSGKEYPKPLQVVGGKHLIQRVIASFERAGVEEIALVVGFRHQHLRDALADHQGSAKLSFVQNDEYLKPNGTSLLKAAELVRGPTFLSMSDHLWDDKLIEAFRGVMLANDECALATDRDIPACPDLDDATKVWVEDSKIVHIDKKLTDYNALDTGLFCINEALIESLKRSETEDGCQLSDGVRELSGKGKMRSIDATGALWVDVDTPETMEVAEGYLREGRLPE